MYCNLYDAWHDSICKQNWKNQFVSSSQWANIKKKKDSYWMCGLLKIIITLTKYKSWNTKGEYLFVCEDKRSFVSNILQFWMVLERRR